SDCNYDGIPDECQIAGHDCNGDGVLDACDVLSGTSADCDGNQVPDECELAGKDCNGDGSLDSCELLPRLALDKVATVATGEYPTALAVADLDGNGKPEVVIGHNGWPEADLTILWDVKRNGTFKKAAKYPAGGYAPTAIRCVDLDRDGGPDIVM